MSFNESHERGRLRIAALKDQTAARALSMQVERLRFDDIRQQGPVRSVSAFNLFQTPPDIADVMAARCGHIHDETRILEPSGGLGRLYKAIRLRSAASVTIVEVAEQCVSELQRITAADTAADVLAMDFLDCSPQRLGLFDIVLMNPPFKMGRDVKHIRHAMEFLKPGGRLVSLCFNGVKQRAALQTNPEFSWELLPDESFRSEGTKAGVAMVTHIKCGSTT